MDDRSTGRAAAWLWLAAAIFACLSVAIINGRPLFYWDTAGYVEQGRGALEKVGLIAKTPGRKPSAEPPSLRAPGEQGTGAAAGAAPDTTNGAATGAPAATVETEKAGMSGATAGAADPRVPAARSDRTVDGSRSIFYSVLAGTLAELRALELLTLLHTAAVLLAVWLPARAAIRLTGSALSPAAATALPVIAAALGSMPFFVAYLMPDIFAPAMVLAIATLTAFLPTLRWWEVLLAVALGALGLVSHLSHLAIALLLVPAALLVTLIVRRGRWWALAAALAVIVGAGFAQQAAVRVIAEKVADSEVVIKPFLTGRLIQDKVGYSYLQAHCPDDAIPTCLLHKALQASDDPYRLTASHIIFERSVRLGSFRLMPEDEQIAVARDQVRFFFAVLKEYPVATAAAFLRNTLIQTGMVSIAMTLPSEVVAAQHEGITGLASGAFRQGTLLPEAPWVDRLTSAQELYYGACLAVALLLLVLPNGAPAEVRIFVVMLLFGLLANAFVCGGISQPATRYGARMIWLLPVAAAFLLMFRRRGA